MRATLTFVERPATLAPATGAEVTLTVADHGLGKADLTRLAALRRALDVELIEPGDVRLEHLAHGSWAWVVLVPGALALMGVAVALSLGAAAQGAVALVALGLVLTRVETPEVTATVRVRCRSLDALDRCLDVARRAKGVTVSGVQPTSDAAVSEGEGGCYERARARAEAMAARAGLRVVALASCEALPEAGAGPAHFEAALAPASRRRASVGDALTDMTLAPAAGGALRFVFEAERA
jgi:hypothetical protein